MQLTAKLTQLLPIQIAKVKMENGKNKTLLLKPKCNIPKKYVYEFGEIKSMKLIYKLEIP